LLRAAASAAVVVGGLRAPGLGVLVADGGMEVEGMLVGGVAGAGDGVDGVEVPVWACAIPAAPIRASVTKAVFIGFHPLLGPADWRA
jgi:hypothetical protein